MSRPYAERGNTTTHEIVFLDGIVEGKWCERGNPRRALESYIKTAPTRRWDSGVNVASVVAHADRLLREVV